MKTYKELLPTRIPEYLQGESNLEEYLEVAGELFDEYAATIDDLRDVWDYERTSVSRLRELARQFSLEFPRNLDEELRRSIVRDLHAIYKKSGTLPLVEWIFHLIGWDVEFENAWLLNPDRYDPKIKEVYQLDDYDKSKKSPTIITDYDRNDYRDFLIGDEIVLSNGTYFKGRRFFDQMITFPQQEIVGESYDDSKTRTPDKVGATPYIFIRVSEEDYNIFIAPYEDPDTGIVYEYTQSEFFQVVTNIFNFFLFDDMRPTHVRVVGVLTTQKLDNTFVVGDDVSDKWEAEPLELDTTIVIDELEESVLQMPLEVGPLFASGAPPHPYSKDMVLSSIGFRNITNQEEEQYINQDGSNYTVLREEDYPVPRAAGTSFRFITPHEESFSFRRVYYGEDTSDSSVGDIGVSSGAYDDDLDSIHLSFDLVTSRFGMIGESSDGGIIVRNSTTVKSPNFTPAEEPDNKFEIGNIIEDEEGGQSFDLNMIVSFDMRPGGERVFNQESKDFVYLYDIEFLTKESNLNTGWDVLVDNPKSDWVNTLENSNTIIPRFRNPIPYDFVLDIEYQAQPEWENRE